MGVELIIKGDGGRRRPPKTPQEIRKATISHYLTCSIGPREPCKAGCDAEHYSVLLNGAGEAETTYDPCYCDICHRGDFSLKLYYGPEFGLAAWMEAYLEWLGRERPATLMALAQRGLR
jgi:hypothetical protein